MTIIGGLTWRIRLVTFEQCRFPTSSFNFGLPTYFVSHGYCYGRAFICCFLIEEQSCLTVVCQMTCQRSHICWCASCWHNVFVLLVQFALVHFVWLRQKLVLLSFKNSTVHINLLEYFCFLEIVVCVYPLTLFVIWHSGTTWFKYIDAHAKSLLTISCVLYAAIA